MPLLADLFFRGGGIPRLQLGFDSPNKAAVLLGCLALCFAVAAFRLRRRPFERDGALRRLPLAWRPAWPGADWS